MGPAVSARTLQRIWTYPASQRLLSCSASLASGHNRWSKIRHDKAKEDAVKSKERTALSQEIILASKNGGPDPTFNTRLAFAIANAKRGQFSKTSIDAAIAKGQGKSPTGAALESVMIEAMLPFGVAAILEYETDSKGRTLQDSRSIIKDFGGMVTPTSFLFDRKGKVWFETKEGIGIDEAMDAVIEAGADDISMEDGRLVVETSPSETIAVAQRLQTALQLAVYKTEILFEPKEESLVSLSEKEDSELQKMIDSLEEDPTLQALYTNATT